MELILRIEFDSDQRDSFDFKDIEWALAEVIDGVRITRLEPKFVNGHFIGLVPATHKLKPVQLLLPWY